MIQTVGFSSDTTHDNHAMRIRVAYGVWIGCSIVSCAVVIAITMATASGYADLQHVILPLFAAFIVSLASAGVSGLVYSISTGEVNGYDSDSDDEHAVAY